MFFNYAISSFLPRTGLCVVERCDRWGEWMHWFPRLLNSPCSLVLHPWGLCLFAPLTQLPLFYQWWDFQLKRLLRCATLLQLLSHVQPALVCLWKKKKEKEINIKSNFCGHLNILHSLKVFFYVAFNYWARAKVSVCAQKCSLSPV